VLVECVGLIVGMFQPAVLLHGHRVYQQSFIVVLDQAIDEPIPVEGRFDGNAVR
jgi:hypothetical protein